MDLLQHLGSLLTMSKPRKAYLQVHDEKFCENAEPSSFLVLYLKTQHRLLPNFSQQVLLY